MLLLTARWVVFPQRGTSLEKKELQWSHLVHNALSSYSSPPKIVFVFWILPVENIVYPLIENRAYKRVAVFVVDTLEDVVCFAQEAAWRRKIDGREFNLHQRWISIGKTHRPLNHQSILALTRGVAAVMATKVAAVTLC